MDFGFYYTKEQEEFRKEVSGFLEEIVLKEPIVPVAPYRLTAELYRQGRVMQRKLGAKGWFAPSYPKKYGGGGLSMEQCVVILEELAKIREERRWPEVHNQVQSVHTAGLMAAGTEEQKLRFLPAILRGEVRGWQCFTEPEAGSDEASMKSTAVRDGDVFIINGDKVFVGETPAPIHPDYLYWPAITDPKAPRRENISAFFIPADVPGITFQPLDLIAAEGQKWEVICEDVRCPADRLIGELNKGWLITQGTLAAEHGGGGALIPGGRDVLKVIDYCKRTLRNGQPLSKDPMVQDLLIKLYIEFHVGRLWGLRNYAMSQRQIPRVPYTGTQTSLHRKRHSPELGKMLMDILGPYCLIDDPELQVLFGAVENEVRMADVTHIGGTPEVQQIMMSRALGLGRSAAQAAART